MAASSTCIKFSAYKTAARIDIHVEVPVAPFKDLSQMTERMLHQFAEPDATSLDMLRMAMEKLKLSARAYGRILKVARTIADLESIHIAEAIGYRNLDRGDWAERGI